MLRCFFFTTLLLSFLCGHAQPDYLWVKKGGKKKRTFVVGDHIHVKRIDGTYNKGQILMLRNDTIFMHGFFIPKNDIAQVILGKKKKRLPVDGKTLLLITAGTGLTAIGLSLNNYQKPGTAISIAAAIGFGPILVRYLINSIFYTVARKKFRIGKKYQLQMLDIYIPQRKGF